MDELLTDKELELPFKITLEQFDLPDLKIIEEMHMYIELLPWSLIYRGEYWSNEPKDWSDKNLGNEDYYHNFINKIKRVNIISLDKIWSQRNDCWKIEIDSLGYPSIIVYFKSEKQCDTAYKILDKYIFPL